LLVEVVVDFVVVAGFDAEAAIFAAAA